MKISFVLLQYMNYSITEESVQALLAIKRIEECNIVIVDNGSTNNAFSYIRDKYSEFEFIYTLNTGENLGFARGNNYGYMFSKTKLHVDVCIIMNNDVIIDDKNFINNLEFIVLNSNGVHILCPDIRSIDGQHQNPFRFLPISNKTIILNILYNIIVNLIYRVPLLNAKFVKHINMRHKSNCKCNNVKFNLSNNTFVPHGSCIIFLGEYIKNENLAFCEKTFLYMEEDILYEKILVKKYNINLVDSLVVLHLEDATTNDILPNSVSRRLFKSTHMLKSLLILLLIRLSLLKP